MPKTSLLTLTFLLAAPAAIAATFEQLDSDANGLVSREEFLALRQMMFETIDTDNSGTITQAEIDAARESASATRQKQFNKRLWEQDTNGDGVLSLSEYTSQTRGFDFADRNNDGALSPKEYARVSRFLNNN